MSELAQKYIDLFHPYPGYWGRYGAELSSDGGKGGKLECDPRKIRTEFHVKWELKHIQAALEGKERFGLAPLWSETGKVWFIAIDIDGYKADMPGAIALRQKDIYQLAKDLHKIFPQAVPTRSKSGGLHWFIFFKEASNIVPIRHQVRQLMSLLGMGNYYEVFPKKDSVAVDKGEKSAGWINGPYFNYTDTQEYAFDPETGSPLTIDQFFDLAEKSRVSEVEFSGVGIRPGKTPLTHHQKTEEEFPFGPPCLNNMAEQGFAGGNRNTTLYGIAIYYKKSKPGEWESLTHEANLKFFKEPLPAHEVNGLIGSIRGKPSSNYQCTNELFVPHCNKPLCQRKRFGVCHGGAGTPLPCQLMKWDSANPTWLVTFDDGRTLSCDVEALTNQGAFTKACINQLNFVPAKIKAEDFQKFMGSLMQTNLTIEKLPYEATVRGQIDRILQMYVTSRALSSKLEDLRNRKPVYLDGTFYISYQYFIEYFNTQNKNREITESDVGRFLQHFGGRREESKINGVQTTFYVFPESLFSEQRDEVLPLPDGIQTGKVF